MKMKKLTTLAILLGSVGFLATSASASIFSSDDLILSFRNTSGTSSSGNNLEVDLGSSFNFNQSQTISALTTADLITAFGSTDPGTSNSNYLRFSVDGIDSSDDIFVTDSSSNPLSSSNLGGATANTTNANYVGRLYNNDGSPTSDSAASSGAGAATILVASDGTSYSSALLNVDTAYNNHASFTNHDFQFLSTGVNVEKILGTNPSVSMDIYELFQNQNAPQDLGTFTLTSAGALTYTAAPEPSTYALMGLAGLAILFVRRRMQQA